jgi:hypothetical protein
LHMAPASQRRRNPKSFARADAQCRHAHA